VGPPIEYSGFLWMPPDIATYIYYTALDPFTGQEVHVARGLRDRKMQRESMQFFTPENDFMVREALLRAGRGDLIGNGCDCLIPSQPPRAALLARMEKANQSLGEGKYVHQIPTAESKGYRPGRKSARRQPRKGMKDANQGRGAEPHS
jgi:Domain of unknown function (DUF3362)